MSYKNRNYKLFLKDILDSSNKILEYTKNYNKESFLADIKTTEAVEYNLILIGEASKFIPDNIKSDFMDIPFEEIAGLRNRLAHDYLGIDLNIIWAIVETDIPKLKTALEKIIQ